MIALTRAPFITFEKVGNEHVRFAADQKALEKSYGRSLHVKTLLYCEDQIASVTVLASGREICVDLTGSGIAYTLKFQEFEDAKQVYTNDYRFYNMTRN